MLARKSLLLFLLPFFMLKPVFASSISGPWVSHDERTGDKRAVIKLNVNEDKVLSGRVIKVYPQPGDTGICSKCPGDLKDKRIKQINIIWGVRYVGDQIWEGGHILDPQSGKIYKVRMRQKGDKLYLRAYVGMPVLGRTQIWERIDQN